jgi:hypothetical protein
MPFKCLPPRIYCARTDHCKGAWKDSGSEHSFRCAVELDPAVRSYTTFALYLLLILGRIDEALHQRDKTLTADAKPAQTHKGETERN